MIIQKGIIREVSGHPKSGLWTLKIESGPGVEVVHIESGHRLRQLATYFGYIEGSGNINEKLQGQEIYYSTEFLNVLDGFTPLDEAPEEMVKAYEKERPVFYK